MTLPASSSTLLPAGATLRFLTSRRQGPGAYLEAREDEPTLEALRWAAEITALLSGDPVTPVPFIDECRRAGGTFAMTAADSEPSRAASYYAVRAFTLTGRQDEIPGPLPRWFVGEVATPGLPATFDIDEMFYVLRALEQLDALGLLGPEVSRSLVDFLQSCRAGDGGYAGTPGLPPDTEHTYCAVCSLSLLGEPLDAAESRATAAWLRSRFDTPSGLSTLTAQDETPSLAATYWGFRAGEVLDTTVWTDRLGPAVASLGKPGGGFGARDDATLWESYCALRVLTRLAAAHGGGR
ncbi:prenyltransferase/squalene oxidase repeat-containing protein [Spirillospora sp. NPDC047279]|uniref:prenyltransferase/squalene oxidase repeat-containing protein n=1 Tax=Spirillospora sp. NPDC047279 TaxID=3155478 RepID=UPI0033F5A30C